MHLPFSDSTLRGRSISLVSISCTHLATIFIMEPVDQIFTRHDISAAVQTTLYMPKPWTAEGKEKQGVIWLHDCNR